MAHNVLRCVSEVAHPLLKGFLDGHSDINIVAQVFFNSRDDAFLESLFSQFWAKTLWRIGTGK
jgi:hypothetical protein